MFCFNWESVCHNAEDLCPQLAFDQSIKMPAANNWAKGDGVVPLDLCGLGHRREEERRIIIHRRQIRLELQKENHPKCR